MDNFNGTAPNLDDLYMRDQVAIAIKSVGGVKKMSEFTGIPAGTLEKYNAKSSSASLINAAKISAAAGISLSKMAGLDVAVSTSGGIDAAANLIHLPLFDVEAAAGTGRTVQAENAVDIIAFDRKFLRDHGASPEHCAVIRAKGDSMVPTIPDGSLLIVDHSQQDVAHGFITVIGIDNDLLVKRVRRRLDGAIELISDNPAYPPEMVSNDRLDQLRVIGRVVYFCRVP